MTTDRIETAEAHREAVRRFVRPAYQDVFVAGVKWQASRPDVPAAGLRVTREAVGNAVFEAVDAARRDGVHPEHWASVASEAAETALAAIGVTVMDGEATS